MKFIDSIQIQVRAGKGGNGIVSFKSGKGKLKLGADGGDGGIGGDVVLVGNPQLNTLSSLRYRALYKAEDGERGGSNGCRGKSGEDLVIPVPLGTMIHDADTGELLGEILDEQPVIIAKGGHRGLGNIHWLSPTHQAPSEFKPGAKGEERELRLELKLVADVGLAGFPNAGKSTLLSRISAARPKIADYPFTTLIPNLGVVELGPQYWGEAVVVADVPGLIEGASEGRGLGLAFLRHLERTSIIAYVLDAFGLEQEPVAALGILQQELQRFSPELAGKRAVVILNKLDLVDDEIEARLTAELAVLGLEVLPISAVSGRGIDQFKLRLHALVKEEKARLAADAAAAGAEQASTPAAKSGITYSNTSADGTGLDQRV
jgi:GTP-binding protein